MSSTLAPGRWVLIRGIRHLRRDPTWTPLAEEPDGPPPIDPRCGTTAGYSRHYRVGERPCTDCREASITKRRARKLGIDIEDALKVRDITIEGVVPILRQILTTLPPGRTICDDCGCLLIGDEDCPQCEWVQRQERRAA